MILDADIRERLAELSPAERAVAESRLKKMMLRRAALARFPTPAHLDQFVRPDSVQTPMLDRIDQAIMSADAGHCLRWIVNTPPQEGKTSRLQTGSLWLLLRDPTRRIVFASYEQGIAQQSGLAVRQIIETFGGGIRGRVNEDREDVLGLVLDPSRAAAANWSLTDIPGRRNPGGVLSVGVGSALTGRPADVLIVDDPLKGAKEADSPVYRRAVQDWYQSVASTRLSSRAIVIIIQTRWHEDDLTGWLLEQDKQERTPRYRHLSIPAQAESVDDPLGRAPGEWLVSARGRTVRDWEERRKDVTGKRGSRWWFALYQQNPSPTGGGVFKTEWFDRYRMAAQPELVYALVMVDPADNEGSGDEAGVIVGGLTGDGRYAIVADYSGHYTVAQWARRAILAVVKHGAAGIRYEQSLSGLKRGIRAEWKVIRRQARVLAEQHKLWSVPGVGSEWPERPNRVAVENTLAELTTPEDSASDTDVLLKQLLELWEYVPGLQQFPETGPPIGTVPAKGTKIQRASWIQPLYETGRAFHVGHFPKLERQYTTWMPPQDSPDRMDAAVHLLNELSKMEGQAKLSRPTGTVPTHTYAQAGQGIQRTVTNRR